MLKINKKSTQLFCESADNTVMTDILLKDCEVTKVAAEPVVLKCNIDGGGTAKVAADVFGIPHVVNDGEKNYCSPEYVRAQKKDAPIDCHLATIRYGNGEKVMELVRAVVNVRKSLYNEARALLIEVMKAPGNYKLDVDLKDRKFKISTVDGKTLLDATTVNSEQKVTIRGEKEKTFYLLPSEASWMFGSIQRLVSLKPAKE